MACQICRITLLLLLFLIGQISSNGDDTINLLRTSNFTVRGWYLTVEDHAFLEDQSAVRNDSIELRCNRDAWKNSELNIAQQGLLLDADSDFSTTFGSFTFRAQLPTTAYDNAEFSLVSTNCRLINCTTPLKGRTTGLTLFEDSPRTVDVEMNYINPTIASQRLSQAVTVDRPNKTTSGFHVYKVTWSQYFVTWFFDGTMVANFTNRLILPRSRHFVRIELYCRKDSINNTRREDSTLTIETYQRIPNHEIGGDMLLPPSNSLAPDVIWNETLVDRAREMLLFAYDEDVVVYFDEIRTVPGCNCNKTLGDWVFDFAGAAWRYIDRQYGPLNLTMDHSLHALLHVGAKGEGCQVETQFGHPNTAQYILSCSSKDSRNWDVSTDSPVKSYLSQAIANLTVRIAGGIFGNPMKSMDQSVIQDIVQYDVLLFLDEKNLARSLLSSKIGMYQNTPRSYSYWLRGWYLPIYARYGQAEVLRRFFALLTENLPVTIDKSGMRRYSRNMTSLGEVVHFWSGAANASLRTVASSAFGWSENNEKELLQAQKDFPDIHYPQDENYLLTQATLTVPLDYEETTAATQSSAHTTVLVSVVVPVIVTIAVAAVLGYCFVSRKRRRANAASGFPRNTANKTISPATLSKLSPDIVRLIGEDIRPFLVPARNLQISTVILGEGEFGTVHVAVASGLYGAVGSVSVAAKVLKLHPERATDGLMTMFIQEVRVMIRAGQHLNLVNVLGFTLDDKPTLLLELCKLGSLLMNLQECQRDPSKFVSTLDSAEELNRQDDEFTRLGEEPSDEQDQSLQLSTSDLVSFAYQVSRGMEHLSAKNIVHRDIAARNILLTKTKIAKISDFGMAKHTESAYMMSSTSAANLPVRWMSPEAIASMTFDRASDVWSYGVLLWEMFSLGQVPYPNVAVAGRVEQFGEWLSDGNRLEKPQFCPDSVFNEMGKCWSSNAADRPSFAILRTNLEAILAKDVAGYYMHLSEPYERFNEEHVKSETYIM